MRCIREGVLGEMRGWKCGMVDGVYGIWWVDGMDYKVKDENGRGVRGGI